MVDLIARFEEVLRAGGIDDRRGVDGRTGREGPVDLAARLQRVEVAVVAGDVERVVGPDLD